MRLLTYKDLDLSRVKTSFDKVKAMIEADDFRSADVKKLNPSDYYRAKLDYSNRLLLRFARIGEEMACLALEVIENHAYDRSRFLRGAQFDENKLNHEPVFTNEPVVAREAMPLRWVHPTRNEFELLDKPIMFDDDQVRVHRLPLPTVVVGSAGSGKTAVTLTKLREMTGQVLYVTQSPYLAQSARAHYTAFDYENQHQEVQFLSYRDLIETLKVPLGREVTFKSFAAWFERHRQAQRSSWAGLDAHAVFEEFKGVLGSDPKGPLGLSEYLTLGVRQSLLNSSEREAAYALFERYRQWLKESEQYDLNFIAHEWHSLAKPTFDFVVIDEVQDLTNVQLSLVLALLKKTDAFLLCGDSNQIVHPNFFSWSAVRALFWKGVVGVEAEHRQELTVLQANFRNTRAVNDVANRLLKIKQARFGSIDRESNFLVSTHTERLGSVSLVAAKESQLRDLDAQSRVSVQHAVVVLRDEDKAQAREHFKTPLVFSVHEAKGLEYPHVILYAIISGQRSAFTEVCEGVELSELEKEELAYKRPRDKGDKSLELFKFFVNSLYVALTRAVETLVFVESDTDHPLLGLLGLEIAQQSKGATFPISASSKEDWVKEALKLEMQGKDEQAQAIRDAFLKNKETPWNPWSQALMQELKPRAFDRTLPSNKPRQNLFEYCLWHGQDEWIRLLAKNVNFQPAVSLFPPVQKSPKLDEYDLQAQWREADYKTLFACKAVANLRLRQLQPYAAHNFKDILRECDLYGVDHLTTKGVTPLSLAARAGNVGLVKALIERGANPQIEDEFGHTPWLFALNRAIDDPVFAKQSIGPLFDLLSPPFLDVQIDERLIRLERTQSEYWVLSVMIAGFKNLRTQWTKHAPLEYIFSMGFTAQDISDCLVHFPDHLWRMHRRKKTHVSAVLARAEIDSNYIPSRKLWTRVKKGMYLPNPAMKVRDLNLSGRTAQYAGWRPICDVLNISWVEELQYDKLNNYSFSTLFKQNSNPMIANS